MNKNSIGKKWCCYLMALSLYSPFCFSNPHSYETNPELKGSRDKGKGVCVFTAQQQQQQITGTVTDQNGMVMPGVTVVVPGTTNSTITDANGQFSITAEEGAVLVFSFMGYKDVTVTVTGSRIVNVTLQEDATALQEVTVNAGYYTVKDKERTGSIAKITSKDIEKQPVSNVLAAMQGRMAGVDIIQDGGTAGGGFQIKIRGVNSLRADGNSPLYIIDGVPYSSETIGYSQTTTGMATPTSPLNSINPSDIESIEVLKDADATAIYGSRGANGVVLITTKKGKAGKTKFSLNSLTGVGKVARFLELMNTEQYLAMRRQAYVNDGIANYPANAYDVNGTWDQSRYTDWQKELIGGTAEITDIQFGVSGGSAQMQYLLSGSRRKETTVIPGDFDYNRTAVHFNMNHTSDDSKFKVSFSGGYTLQDNKQPATDLTKLSRTLAPNAPALYDVNGDLNWENNTFQNPLASLNSFSTVDTKDLFTNAILTYSVLPNLEIKTNFGYTNVKNHEQRLIPSTVSNPAQNITSANSQMYDNFTERNSVLFEPQLNWKKKFAKSTLDVLVGGTAQKQITERMYAQAGGVASNALITNLASASIKLILASDITEYKYQAFFGRINYNYKEKYILNATGRRDGSSRFGPGKQFATFGALGAAWIFSNENILKQSKILSFGKLRMSYGATGNDQIGDYQFLNTYSTTSLNYQGIVGLEPTRLYNPDYGWESSTKIEAALEAGFLNDRIFLTGAWYRNRSSNQLVGIPLPGTTGFTTLNANLAATVENKGIEVTLRTVNFSMKDFKWTTNFNISAARNKLVAFPGLSGSTFANTYVVGEPTSIIKVYEFTGVNPQTGLYEVADLNGDGIINAIGDRQKTMDLTPKYFGGFQNQFQYRDWQLDFLFQFVKQQVSNYTPNVSAGYNVNQSTTMLNAWQQIGDSAPYQMYTTGANSAAATAFSRYASSDAMIVDGSYIRLKNIALIYALPLGLKGINCKLSLQGQNVLTFTHYKGGDPEFRYTNYLPPLRVFTAGIQLNF
ncbi:SusC/RagA family TonB-linked outer membrane protein [Flavobacterium capsici]|uniref:SusC/RagA family TonB-linked outer membrane protein n=1 Tax=Flavobacterium capsici TaxID=3075618 RepID=A0AA96F3U3_9FLAO|nr:MULTISPECIES: SusC/RagA family TonB-linked outer membrane protein [unclassified Flavobacterium]WNM19481.1 SusC/RagA family TonB-linked outer membrane protein [Flavobacterium sp. PMR2A8]WNM20870.1 SusC/RagA family TonB-linked outer membrane protein [Flavobacterium sp. PMTSA4]